MSTNTTIKQKLQKLLSAKTSLMTALNSKGATITSSTPLSSYSEAVTNLPTGGGGGEGGVTFTNGGISVSNTSLSTESPILAADGSFTLTLATGANINSLTISHAYDMYSGACSSNTLSLYISSGASLTTQTDLSFDQFNSCLIDIQNTSLNRIYIYATSLTGGGGGGYQPGGGGGGGSSFANGVLQSFSINISNALINEMDFFNFGTISPYYSTGEQYGGVGNITISNTIISNFNNLGSQGGSTDLTFTSLNATSSFINLNSSIAFLNAQFNNCTSVSIPYVHNTIKLISCTNINNSYTGTPIPGGSDYYNTISGQKSILISGCSNFSADLCLGNNVSLYNCDFTNQSITLDSCTYLSLQGCVSIGNLSCTAYLNLSSSQGQTSNGINVTGLNMPSNAFVMNVSYSLYVGGGGGGGGDMSQYISAAAQSFFVSIQSATVTSIHINNLLAGGGGGYQPGGGGVSYYFNSFTLNNVSTTLLELSTCAFNSTIINNTIISNSDESINEIIYIGWTGLTMSNSYINHSLTLSGSSYDAYCIINNAAISYFDCGWNNGMYGIVTINGNYSSGDTQINYGTISNVAFLQGSGFSAAYVNCFLCSPGGGGGGMSLENSFTNLSNVSIGNLIIDGNYCGNSGSASFTSCSIDNFSYTGSTYYQGDMSGSRNITFTDCTFPVSLTSNDYEGLRANIASGNTMYINGNQIIGSSGGGW